MTEHSNDKPPPTVFPADSALTSPLAVLADIPEEEIWLAKQKSARTRRAYKLDVRHFMQTLMIRSYDELRQVDHRAVISWERIMREIDGAAHSTVRRRLAALSSLFKHLVRHGHAKRNPVAEVERPSINRREGSTLAFSQEQARLLLDTPQRIRLTACATGRFCPLAFRWASAERSFHGLSARITQTGATQGRRHLGAQVQGTPQASPAKRAVKLLRGSEIESRNVEWLWKGFLPLGMLTLMGGDAGTGKSTLAFSLAATVTLGGAWPDGSHLATAGNVLIWSGKDSAQLTIAPRMLAAGCDPNRYGVIEGVTDERGESLSFDPAQDVPLLRQTAESIGGVSLLVIDPLISAVAGDAHRANDVRRYLQPIVDLAGELNCAVIGIHHQAKNSAGRDAVSRLLGSQAFTALARMVMQTVRVKESDNRVITISKSNITLDRGGFAYTIEPVQLDNGVSTTAVKWGAAVEGTAQSIIDDAEGIERTSKPMNKVGEAETFLHEELRNGPRAAREMIELARQLGIHPKTLERAREKRGIVTSKAGKDAGWMWHYPFALS